jgi:hypothetical protein
MFAQPRPKILYGGAGGGGKSHGERAALIYYHLHAYQAWGARGVRTMLATDSYVTLRDRFIGKFKEEYSWLGTIKQSKDYGLAFHFKSEDLGVIALRNLDDPDKYRGTEAAAIAIDEASILPPTIEGSPLMSFITYPLRSTTRGIETLPLILGSNWDGPSGEWMASLWYYRDGFKREEFANYDPDEFVYIPAKIDDNPDTQFVESFKPTLLALTGALRESRLLGVPTKPQGAAFPSYSDKNLYDAAEMFPSGIPADWPIFVHVDWGIADPYCALWTAVDRAARCFYTFREDYETGLTDAEQATRIIRASPQDRRVMAVYHDPAMRNRRARDHEGKPGKPPIETYELIIGADERFGSLRPGNNTDRIGNLRFVDELLSHSEDKPGGLWNLYIERNACPRLLSELRGAVWDTRHHNFIPDLSPSSPDHAITAGYYGWRSYIDNTGAPEPMYTPAVFA